jgi:hypothetical protein
MNGEPFRVSSKSDKSRKSFATVRHFGSSTDDDSIRFRDTSGNVLPESSGLRDNTSTRVREITSDRIVEIREREFLDEDESEGEEEEEEEEGDVEAPKLPPDPPPQPPTQDPAASGTTQNTSPSPLLPPHH